MQWLEEAEHAQSVADRVQKQTRALEAILHADSDLLGAALDVWLKKGGSNVFVRAAWRRLTQKDEARALKMLEKPRRFSGFDEAAYAVHGYMAHSHPDHVYEEVQRLCGPKNTCHWYAEAILTEVGGEWLRREHLGALSRLNSPTLSAPMRAAVFEGFVEAASTVDERLALLERFVGDEEPAIHEQTREPYFCDALVEASAREDLPKTRACIERLFPPGTARVSDSWKAWNIRYVRHSLFRFWARADPMAAADWLMAQHGKDDPEAAGSLQSCAAAIAGEDEENITEALGWLQTQSRRDGVKAAVVRWFDHPARSKLEREGRLVIGRWLAALPAGEREAALMAGFEGCSYGEKPFQLRADDPFMTLVFPEEELRQQVVQRMKLAAAEPKAEETPVKAPDTAPFSFEMVAEDNPPWGTKGFEVPVDHEPYTATAQDTQRSRELAREHRLTWRSDDAAERLAGLNALQWMMDAAPAELKGVLLAHLRQEKGGMTLFANDLIECWAVRDWRECERFVWKADLPPATRREMLIQLFSEAALRFPDEVLQRLRELIDTGMLAQDALNADLGGQRSRQTLHHDSHEITKNLACGWTLENDAEALRKIQTLPLKWQPMAFRGFLESFTTTEAGLAMLDLIVERDVRRQSAEAAKQEKHGGLKSDSWAYALAVLGRLARTSCSEARAWLEARPERMTDSGNNYDDGVWVVYQVWREKEADAADEWLWRNRPGEIALHRIVKHFLDDEETEHATVWLEKQRDHEGINGGLAAFADHWRKTQPQETARYVLQMKGQLRQVYAIDLMQSWREADAGAAAKFMDQAFPPGTSERKEADAESKRMDELMQNRPQ
ncbi:hypothetical protein [Prosthecobacter sp.]|uniref:hypothetical protein n=1 Tax=Prosthecobacter sp. TaxID=1965333 RepID=UPI003784FC6D